MPSDILPEFYNTFANPRIPILPPNQPGPERITFVTQEFRPKIGGAATVVDEISRATQQLGWETRILAPGTSHPDDADSPVPIERMGTRGKQDWPDRLKLLRYLRQRPHHAKERIVWAEPGSVRAALYLWAGPSPTSTPPHIILHGTEILRLTSLPHRRILFRRLLQKCERIHVLSDYNRQLLQSRIPGLRTPIIVAPGAPSRTGIANSASARSSGSQDKRITILTVGRIHPRKGQLDSLKALSLLSESDQNQIRYRIVGPSVRSNYREQIVQLAKKCSFPVELTGPLNEEDLEKEYEAADIFALTSRQTKMSVEGFGLVYLDASALGLPVVATRSGGIPEAVIEGKSGLLASEGNITEISECFERLITDSALRRQLGDQGMQHASSQSWIKTAQSYFGKPESD
mgnify:CR=1 FL=1